MSRTETDTQAVRKLFAAHDPAASVRADPAHKELSRIEVVAAGRRRQRVAHLAPRRPVLRTVLVAAAVVTAVAVLTPMAWNSVEPAYAGPPPTPLEVRMTDLSEGREPLLALAGTAEGQPPPPGNGDVAYVHTSQWTLTYSQDLDSGEEGWGVLPVDEQVWRAPGESGKSVTTPSMPEHLGGDRNPVQRLFDEGPTEFEWGGGEGGNGMFFTVAPEDLSTDPETLTDQLIGRGTDVPREAGDGVALVYALQDVYGEAPVEPAVQAAVLRALAEQDDVMYAGEARDREGREGELFVVEGDAGDGYVLERRMMFDADTGMPLYHETVAVESSSAPDEDLPQVNNYTVLVESAWVPAVGDTP